MLEQIPVTMLLVSLQCVIVAFPGHTHLLFGRNKDDVSVLLCRLAVIFQENTFQLTLPRDNNVGCLFVQSINREY